MIAGGELGFGFWQIEGGSVGFGIGRRQVDEEGYELKAAKDVPGEQAVGGLTVYDGAQVQRPARKTTPTSDSPRASS